jgi:hypothetical protein
MLPSIELLPLLPLDPGFNISGSCAKIMESPGHSHSIVSGTYNYLKIKHFFSGQAKLTVTSTAKHFRLGAIDGDRWRKQLSQVDGSHRIRQ